MQFQMQSHDCCESKNCAHVEFVKKKLRDLHNSLIGLAYIGWYLVILYLIIYLNKLSVFSTETQTKPSYFGKNYNISSLNSNYKGRLEKNG